MSWTTIPDDQIDQDSPITQPLMTALRDNPIAIADGLPGAPSILRNVAVNSALGGVGTYVLAAVEPGGDFSSGTIPGADLSPAGTYSGTWRLMGQFASSAALWVRIV